MDILFFLFIIILAASALIICGSEFITYQDSQSGEHEHKAIGFTFILLGLALFLSFVYVANKPRAIDVYRGNTRLEITYRDSIPMDSVVVFK